MYKDLLVSPKKLCWNEKNHLSITARWHYMLYYNYNKSNSYD